MSEENDPEEVKKEKREKKELSLLRLKKISLALGLIISLGMIAAGLTYIVYSYTKDSDLFSCRVIFPFVEFYFICWLLLALFWSLFLYFELRPLYVLEIINHSEKTSNNKLSFHELAEAHKQWAQLWFTISISIVISGLIYATFHVGSHACHWVIHPTNTWKEIVASTLPNLFIYSLFFVSWQWSSRHFRAHWHNFITNAYRHRSLVKFQALENFENPEIEIEIENKDKSATIAALRRLAGLLLLVPRESAYLSLEKEDTVTERMLRMEELIRETLIGK